MIKALVKAQRAVGLELQHIPKPRQQANDQVVIKIKQTAICGTDIHIYNWDNWAQQTIPVPLVIGHEFVGEVAEVATEVDDLQVGELVTGEGHLTCEQCRNCLAGNRHLCRQPQGVGIERAGAFAEYLVLPRANVYRLSEDIDIDTATIYDPLGNATHTALEFDLVGEDVLVTGAGPIGLMVTAIARHVGARHIVTTDVNPYRLRLAEQMGATLAVNVANDDLKKSIAKLNMREGFDIGFEMSGNAKALQQMLEHLNHGAKVSLLGIFPQAATIDWNTIILKGLTLKGIYGRKMFDTWYKTTSMLQSGLDIKRVITHHYPIDDYQTAFATMRSGQSGKVIMVWG